MRAQSETAFYLIELLKVLAPVGAIGVILATTLLFHRVAPRPSVSWLAAVTGSWLVVTLLSRGFLSSPVMNHYLSGQASSGEEAQAQVEFYSRVTSLLWAGEHVMLLLFAVALFLALRPSWRAKLP